MIWSGDLSATQCKFCSNAFLYLCLIKESLKITSEYVNKYAFLLTADQEEHGAILEMAASVKMAIRQLALAKKQEKEAEVENIDVDDVIVSLMADLQQVQDRESETMLEEIQEKVP